VGFQREPTLLFVVIAGSRHRARIAGQHRSTGGTASENIGGTLDNGTTVRPRRSGHDPRDLQIPVGRGRTRNRRSGAFGPKHHQPLMTGLL
jgi:hypothetical protein